MKRFWEKVNVSDPYGCWEWTAYRMKGGYGQFSLRGKVLLAHRVSLHLAGVLELDSNELVCHHCDNRGCVNPLHLYVGTYSENMKDMVSRKRSAVGESHSQVKLTEESVLEIRRRKSDGASQVSIASAFGVSCAIVSCIVNRKNWTHI